MVHRNLRGLLVLSLLAICSASALSAQITYELLTSAGQTTGINQYYPFNTYYMDNRSEHLYLASDLTAAGVPGAGPISSIALRCAQLPGQTIPQVRIGIRGTTATTLPSGVFGTGYTYVYGPTNIAASQLAVGGWFTFTFNTPWMWNGTDNIVIDFSMDGTSWASGGGCHLRTVSTQRMKAYYSDNGLTWPYASAGTALFTTVAALRITQDGLSVITPPNLPTAAELTTYMTEIQASQGVQPYTWAMLSGSLPATMTLTQVNVAGVNRFRLQGTPPAGSANSYNFTVRVTDGVSNTSTKQMFLYVAPQPVAMPFTDNFSTNKNWQLTGLWARGSAVAYSATGPTRSEPGQDHTATADNMILGHRIGLDYLNNMGATEWATSPPINCQTAANVRLRFWRYLGVSPNDNARIQVSNNGSNWNDVYASVAGGTHNDSAWTSVFYDISQYAAGYSVVQVRFGIGPTDATIANTGWCIDDLEIEEPGVDLLFRENGSTGNPIPDNAAPGGIRDWGVVSSGTNHPITIYMTNNGPTTVNFGQGGANPLPAWSKSGADPSKFFMSDWNTAVPGNTLAPGASTAFTIMFNSSTSTGVFTCTIHINHNALFSGSAPFDINLRAEAIVPTPQIRVNLGSATGQQITHQSPATGTPRDFGTQDIAAGPTGAITIFVTNAGTGTLSVGTPYAGSGWHTEYLVNSAGMTGQLTAGQSTSFTIAFDPSAIGQKDAAIHIQHNGTTTNPSPFWIPVTGNGVSSGGAILKVHDGLVGGPQIPHNDPAAGPRDFGSQLVAGGATPPITITLENSGGAALTLGTPVLGGTNASDFVLSTAGFQTSLTPGASTSFTVAFDPASVGVKIAEVTFTHNDAGVASPFIVNVRGDGVTTAAQISVHETNATGTQLTNPAAAAGILDFGTQDINAGPAAVATIYVENTGTAALTLGMPGFQAPTTEFQLQTTGFAGSVMPGASATFTITFDPTIAGTHTAVVQFTHNDASAGSPFILNLTGVGVLNAPLMEVREGSTIGPIVISGSQPIGTGRDCGSTAVNAGNSFPVIISIANTGTQNLNLSTLTLGGNDAASFQLSTGSFNQTVAPGGATQFDVVFAPALAGMKDCTVQFTHDDPALPSPFIIRFVGTGTDPNAVLITTPTLPGGIPDVAYGPITIQAIQGREPYVWSVYSGNLPAGMALSSSGVVSGTPQGFGGIYNVIVRVQDDGGGGATNEKQYTIVVSGEFSGRGKAKNPGCAVESRTGTGPVLGLVALLALVAGLRLRRREA